MRVLSPSAFHLSFLMESCMPVPLQFSEAAVMGRFTNLLDLAVHLARRIRLAEIVSCCAQPTQFPAERIMNW